MFFSNINKVRRRDLLTKSLIINNRQLPILKKIVFSIHIKKISKLYEFVILQSICLIDTITNQKPMLRGTKCKYTFGARFFSYSCKVTLRKNNLKNVLKFLQFVIFSEMSRRHLFINNKINKQLTALGHYTFSINNTNVFSKLDEFYFKWSTPLFFNIITNYQKNYINLQKTHLNYLNSN